MTRYADAFEDKYASDAEQDVYTHSPHKQYSSSRSQVNNKEREDHAYVLNNKLDARYNHKAPSRRSRSEDSFSSDDSDEKWTKVSDSKSPHQNNYTPPKSKPIPQSVHYPPKSAYKKQSPTTRNYTISEGSNKEPAAAEPVSKTEYVDAFDEVTQEDSPADRRTQYSKRYMQSYSGGYSVDQAARLHQDSQPYTPIAQNDREKFYPQYQQQNSRSNNDRPGMRLPRSAAPFEHKNRSNTDSNWRSSGSDRMAPQWPTLEESKKFQPNGRSDYIPEPKIPDISLKKVASGWGATSRGDASSSSVANPSLGLYIPQPITSQRDEDDQPFPVSPTKLYQKQQQHDAFWRQQSCTICGETDHPTKMCSQIGSKLFV